MNRYGEILRTPQVAPLVASSLLSRLPIGINSLALVLFLSENQGGYGWATLPEGDDPPVWGSVDCGQEPWVEYGVSLSEFLIQACLFEAVNAAAYSASARLDDQAMARLSAATA